MEKYGKKKRYGRQRTRSKRSTSSSISSGDITIEQEVVVPELDEIAKTYMPLHNYWTPYEEAVLRKYCRKVPVKALVKLLCRTRHAIEHHARALGVAGEKKRPPKELQRE